MEEACEYIEKVVNREMHKRKRFPLEWGGEPDSGSNEGDVKIIWRANVAASNRYEGSQESVGFHSDQLTYLGPYPTIASLSLGAPYPVSCCVPPEGWIRLQARREVFDYEKLFRQMRSWHEVHGHITYLSHTIALALNIQFSNCLLTRSRS